MNGSIVGGFVRSRVASPFGYAAEAMEEWFCFFYSFHRLPRRSREWSDPTNPAASALLRGGAFSREIGDEATFHRGGFAGQRGFTLVEVHVVLIIGILAAIAIPTFLSQRERARDSTIKPDLWETPSPPSIMGCGRGFWLR